MWNVQLLGGLTAQGMNRKVTRFRTRKAASLFGYLCYHPAAQSREWLIETFWPETDGEAGRHNLSNALSSLRHVLEPVGVRPGSVVWADRYNVSLNPEFVSTDVAAFESAVSHADEPDLTPSARVALLEQAAAAYHGPLMPGFFEDWIASESARLEGLYVQALNRLAQLVSEDGNWQRAATIARRAVATDPIDEGAVFALMQALAQGGQPGAAAREYHAYEVRLRDEMGEPPSSRLRALLRSVTADIRPPEPNPEKRLAFETARPEAPASAPQKPLPADDDATSASRETAHRRLYGGEFFLRTTTRFFGREREIRRLGEMIAMPRTRLVTLVGPGGIGKTRLAVEATATIVDRVDRGPAHEGTAAPTTAVFVSLAEVSAADRMFELALRTVGAQVKAGERLLVQLADYLNDRPPCVLILDNFEHLIEEGALCVRDLLSMARDVKILITSRVRLNIEGEQEFDVVALPTAPAAETLQDISEIPSVGLFVDRAQAALPDFQLTNRNAESVVALCDYLEGLPLAIELAAARADLFPPHRILAQVKADRLSFLVARRRDQSSRQRTLRATLDWSYDLLSEAARRLLAALSVFRSAWTLEAAIALGSDPEEATVGLLTALRDGSLISVVDGESGLEFCMLETVREYAAHRLDQSGDRDMVSRRHAEYFVGVAERMVQAIISPEGVQTMREIARCEGNFSSALAWIDKNPDEFLQFSLGCALIRVLVGVEWDHMSRRLFEPVERRSRNAATSTGSHFHMLSTLRGPVEARGDPDVGFKNLQSLADLLGRNGQRALQAWMVLFSAQGAMERDLRVARSAAETASALMRQSGDELGIACCFTILSRIAALQGDHAVANEFNAEAVKLVDLRPDPMARALTMKTEGDNALIQGDFPRARKWFKANLDLAMESEKRGYPGPSVFDALLALGMLATTESSFSDAQARLEEALARYAESVGALSALADDARYFLALAKLGLGQKDEARVLAQGCFKRFWERRFRLRSAVCLTLLAEIAAADDQFYVAARLLGASRALQRELGVGAILPVVKRENRLRAKLASHLGNDRFETEEQNGRGLSEEAVLALSLQPQPFVPA